MPSDARALYRILRACVHADSGGSGASDVDRLAARPELPWKSLPGMAERHGVLAQVDHAISAVDDEAIPPAVRSELRGRRRRWTSRSLALAGALGGVLDALAEAGVAAVPFKGPVLAADLYGGVAERQYVDLDVLVRWEELEAAVAALEARDYEPAEEPGPAVRRLQIRQEGVVSLRHPGGAVVEIHGSLFPSTFSLSLALADLDWEERGEGIPGIEGEAGVPLRTLSPEDRLLVLTAHGGKHLWSRLLWVTDVARLLERHPELDTTRVRRRAERLGALRLLDVGVLLAGELLGAPVPRPVREGASAATRKQTAACRERLRAGEAEPTGPAWWWRVMKLRERWSDRLRSFLEFLRPTVVDVRALRLPDALFFLYWPLRPLRLTVSYARRIWR